MNCKPNDLAVIVGSKAGNNGRIAHCERLATLDEVSRALPGHFVPEEDFWKVDISIRVQSFSTTVAYAPYVPDRILRPLTPPPGTVSTDEVRELYSPKQTEAA